MAKKLFDPARYTVFDGAMGTMLQAAGAKPGSRPELFAVEAPEKLVEIHSAYVQAGADVLIANTFGANAKKLGQGGHAVEQIISAAVGCAKKAAAGRALVALDVGPLGEMMEPGGSLRFEEAYELFAQVVRAGQAAGADLVIVETMADLLEIKAAVLAAKEQTGLPVLASMTFEADGRSFAGVQVEAFAAAIGGLGVAGLGINCSLGPAATLPLVQRLCNATALPVFVQPNAGLPNPETGAYTMTAEAFCAAMEPCLEMGVNGVGGCCGTTPAFIERLAKLFSGAPQGRGEAVPAYVCGTTEVLRLDGPMAIGERINPTGKKRLREALQAGDIAYVQSLAVQQQQAGAAVLDVNVGAPGVDEVALLPQAVRAVQAVSGLPLQLDSANPKALEAALRICVGKPIVNSTSGEAEKLGQILPLCRHYGAAVVGLCLDEAGIPPAAEGRVAVAQRILDAAVSAGIPRADILIDGLTLSVAAQPDAAVETLRTVALVKERLGLKTVLGVSNVSFGMPGRPLLNRSFLGMALQAGLDAAILNPCDEEMMGTLLAAKALGGRPGAVEQYAARYGETGQPATAPKAGGEADELPLRQAIVMGLKGEAAKAAEGLVQERPGDTLGIVNSQLIPALDEVGKGFEAGRVFLPQLLAAAAAAQAAFEVLRRGMERDGGGTQNGPPVVVATVQGDVHDIGKNIARVLLENYGFSVTDLGRDVAPEQVVQAARRTGARLVGLSALMTTTLPAMEATIKALREEVPGCRVLVGGAVLTEGYARRIGADFYAKDAIATADYARQVYGRE